jgi:hypothetical protein
MSQINYLCTNALIKVFVILLSFTPLTSNSQQKERKKQSARKISMNPGVLKKIGGAKHSDYINYLKLKRIEARKKGLNDFPILMGNRFINSAHLPKFSSKEEFTAFIKNYKFKKNNYAKSGISNTPMPNTPIGICNNNDVELSTAISQYGNFESNIAVDRSGNNSLITSSSYFYHFLLEDNYPVAGYQSSINGGNSWSGKYELSQYSSILTTAYDDLQDEFAFSYLNYDPYYDYKLLFLKTDDVGAHQYKYRLIYDDWYDDGTYIELPFANNQILYNNYSSSSYYGELYSSWTSMYFGFTPDPDFLYASSLFASGDDGDTFDGPFTLSSNFNVGTTLTYRDDGELYACWIDLGEFGRLSDAKIGFTTIHNNGVTDAPTLIRSVNFPDNSLPAINYKIAVDNSQGVNRGRIYILYYDEELYAGEYRLRTKVIYSSNQGATWSIPSNVALSLYSTGKSIEVDNLSGICYIGYATYDGQDVYTKLAFSEDGGNSFEERIIGDLPPSTTFYNEIGSEMIPIGNSVWCTWVANNANNINTVSKVFFDKINIQRLEVTLPVSCTPGIANVVGLLPGGTVTWSSFPSGIVNITPIGSGQSATINTVASGNVTIYALINGGSCPYALDKNITVQVPNITVTGTYSSFPYFNQPLNNFNPFGPGKLGIALQVPAYPNATYQWQITNFSGGTPTFTTLNASGSDIRAVPNGATYIRFAVKITTSCIEFWKYYTFTEAQRQITYNNVSKIVKIETTDFSIKKDLRLNNKINIADIRFVNVYDVSKRLFIEKKYPINTKQAELNLNGLKAGLYIIETGNLENRNSKIITIL